MADERKTPKMGDATPVPSHSGSLSEKTLDADEKTLAADEKPLDVDEKAFVATTMPGLPVADAPAATGETKQADLSKTMSAKEAMAELNRVMTSGEGIEYPSGTRLNLVTLALCLSVFLMALDNTIIATAIPRITDQFHSLPGEFSWRIKKAVLLCSVC